MFQVVRSSPVPLADQLVESLSTLILTGRLAAGARLPSVRLLARRASVSPFTVTAAFERLLARGLIESRRGSGHFVASNRRAGSVQEVELGPPPQADALARSRAIAAQRLREAGVGIEQLPAEGMFLWARLPATLDANALSVEARSAGILLAPGPMFSATGLYRQHVRFNAAYAADPIVVEFLSTRCRIASSA